MYRYFVQHIGSRGILAGNRESGAEVVDSFTGNPVSVFWTKGGADAASTLAETKCAELNGPDAGLDFAQRFGMFLDRHQGEIIDPRALLEDMDRILEWHIKRLRGLSREPLDQTRLHYQATEFK